MNELTKIVEVLLKEGVTNYSQIASVLIDLGKDGGYSHRTLRRKVAEIHEDMIEDEALDSLIMEDEYPDFESILDEFVAKDMADEIDDLRKQEEVLDKADLETPLDEEFISVQLNKLCSGMYSRPKCYIVIGCVHFPFHNKKLWNAFLKYILYLNAYDLIDGIVLLGDISDMHSISRHGKGKITIPGLTLSKEYALTNVELDRLDEVLPEYCEKYYIYGNHEMWYSQYMTEVDASKLGEEVIKSPKEALRLVERGYNVQTNYKTASLSIGDAELIHGTFVSKHAAHEHVQRMKRTVVFPHTHRVGRYDEGNYEGHNIGWMGDKNAPVFGYMDRIQKESWKNGFAKIEVDTNNLSHITQIVWKGDCFIANGIIFS
jgi:HEPN domain-containing protein